MLSQYRDVFLTHTLWHWHAASVLRDPVVRGTTRRDAPRMSTRSPAAAPVTSMFRSKFSPVSISGRDERTRMTLTASPVSNRGTAGAGVAATVPVASAFAAALRFGWRDALWVRETPRGPSGRLAALTARSELLQRVPDDALGVPGPRLCQ